MTTLWMSACARVQTNYRVLCALLVFAVLAGGCAQTRPPDQNASQPSPQSRAYPFKKPLVATVLGTPSRLKAKVPSKANFSIRTLKPLIDRKTPPVLKYARPLQYLLAAQKGPAPLAFLIAGTGDSALTSSCVLLSRALYAVGYSVACLPSPTSVTFMLGAAAHPVPGRVPADVHDLYRMMGAVRDDLSDTVAITGYSLAGWSLGGTQAAFAAQYDRTHGNMFDFQHVMLINPAVDVWASVRRMDTLLEEDLPGGFDALPNFLAKVLGNVNQFYSTNGEPLQFNEDTLFRAYKAGVTSQKQIGALVGLAFRLALANMAFAADVITKSDVIVPQTVSLSPYDSMDVYLRRSFQLSFDDYINELLVPYWNRDGRTLSRVRLIRESKLNQIQQFLADDKDVHVLTNADDPILDQNEVAFLRRTFGDRALIQPYGGHLGNLSYFKTIHALQEFFAQ